MPETLEIQVSGSAARVTLNRPDMHNAMSNQMISELLDYFTSIRHDRSIRVVVLAAAGKSFCAGGDLKDMQASAAWSSEEKLAKLRQFEVMLRAVNEAPQVTIARVHGAAMGGGLGLVCVSDIAVAGKSASFGLPEVRLGVSPALISPYVITRLGLTRARQLILTGERFGAAQAHEYGLVHEVCDDHELDATVQSRVNEVLQCSPNALAETKALMFYVMNRSLDESLAYRAELINRLRESPDGQEGMLAFIQKRKPSWAE